MNANYGVKTALETAIKDGDLRSLKFTGMVAQDITTQACKDLTAPGLAEMYPQLRKRKAPGDDAPNAGHRTEAPGLSLIHI